MATTTTNLGLKKPATTDKVSIADINENMDILDETLKGLGDDVDVLLDAQGRQSVVSLSSLERQYAVSPSKDFISSVSDWTQYSISGWTLRQRSCAYGNGYYVIAGTSGSLAYSTDAVNWYSHAALSSNVITCLAYGNGRFMAIDSQNVLVASDPSGEWTQVATITIPSGSYIESLTYIAGRFVITGSSGMIKTSLDGENWLDVETGISNDLYAITYGKGLYCAVGLNGQILISVNGLDWEDVSDSASTSQFRAVTYGKGLFIAGGQGGVMRYSTDGRTWSTGTSDSTSSVNYIRGISYLNGVFYAVMYISTGKGEIWKSTDGMNWTLVKTTNGRLWCISTGNEIFFTSGDSGAIYTLDMDIDWIMDKPTPSSGEYLWSREVYYKSDGIILVSEPTVELVVDSALDGASENPLQNKVVNQAIYQQSVNLTTEINKKQNKITTSTSEPTSSDGADGDFWAVYE